jgi:hypothetical protein
MFFLVITVKSQTVTAGLTPPSLHKASKFWEIPVQAFRMTLHINIIFDISHRNNLYFISCNPAIGSGNLNNNKRQKRNKNVKINLPPASRARGLQTQIAQGAGQARQRHGGL